MTAKRNGVKVELHCNVYRRVTYSKQSFFMTFGDAGFALVFLDES